MCHLAHAVTRALGRLLVHVRGMRPCRKSKCTSSVSTADNQEVLDAPQQLDYPEDDKKFIEDDDTCDEDEDDDQSNNNDDLDNVGDTVDVMFATRGAKPFDAGTFFESLSHRHPPQSVRLHDLPGFVRWSGCLDLSTRMPGLAVLEVSHCRIKSLFSNDLTLPPRLTRLVLTYDCLEEFEVALPRSLRDLDLSFNKLTRLPACLENIRDLVLRRADDQQQPQQQHEHHCRLNVHNNNFWFNEHYDIPLGRVNRDTMVELTRAHDWGLIGACKLQRAMSALGMTINRPYNIARHKTTYEDPQNVHKITVQASVMDAVVRIMDDVDDKNTSFDANFVETLVKKMRLSRKVAAKFRIDCASAAVHSGLHVTFGNMCERLLSFVSVQPAADEIFNIMGKEYARNAKVCFTGKVTHLLACLNGFVDGFAVGIDKNDDLANQLIAIRNKWAQIAGTDMFKYIAEALPEAMQVLEDACVPESEQTAWLNGI